jgi:hypothetical protein
LINNTFKNNSIWTVTNTVTNKQIQNVTSDGVNLSIDISAATDIYGLFSKNIFSRQDGTPRLSYYNNSDVLVVVPVNN